ncbi:hypothetical protein CB1_001919002 [Camelus ferus]|nr:hypothetical protein CB1_001919002 [Camelus ferus]
MQQQPLEKKMKPFPMEPYNHNPSEVKVPEFYWDSSYSMADNRAVMAQPANVDRRGKRSPGAFRPEQDPAPGMPFEERYPNNSVFNEVYGKSLTTSSKAEPRPSAAPQEASLYSLFEGTPWSPSLPASSAMGGFGIDYLSATSSSESSWHQASTPGGSWAGHVPSMEDSSAVLMESLKSIWSSSMMHPGPSALEQLLMQQKQKQQRGHGTMNPPH